MNPGPESARLLITCTRGLEDFLLEAGRRVSDADAREPATPEEIERVLGIARKYGQVFAAAQQA